MGETAVQLVKWSVRFGIILSLVLAFVVLLNFTTSLISVTLNQSVIGDLIGLIQIWLPFDLAVILAWVTTASVLYISYRLVMFAAGFVNKFIGVN